MQLNCRISIHDRSQEIANNCDSTIQERIAVVILAWNSESCIERCVRSVCDVSAKSLDVWVVDNGSTDSTPAILSSLACGYDNLHVITCTSNLGTTISRNMAIRRIDDTADIICILDSDTVVNQEAFTVLSRVIINNRDIGVVGPTLNGVDGVAQLSGRNYPTVPTKIGKALPIRAVEQLASDAEIPA
jgi:glycosyltransferase involved in cell wall biosynthesis